MKLLVLYVPAGGGHKSAANAVGEAARARGVEVEIVDALTLTPEWFNKNYINTYLQSVEHAPELYGKAFDALNQKNALVDGVREVADRAVVGENLLAHIAKTKPDVIVSTHFFPLNVLGAARDSGKLKVPVVGVVTDYNAHAFWAESGIDMYTAPAGRAVDDLKKHGIAVDRISTTGIPIRPAFGAVKPHRLPALGKPVNVLITSGATAIGPTIDVIRSFKDVPNTSLTVICGDNSERIAEVKRVVAETGVVANVLGFEPDMAKHMAAAHVLVGKPGGLTVSESLAAGRPMVLVGAFPGQETLNQEWMISQGIAVSSKPELVGVRVAGLCNYGGLKNLVTAGRAHAAPQAADRVVDVAMKLGAVDTKFVETWNKWLKDVWPALYSGKKVDMPTTLTHPKTVGFTYTRWGSPVGQKKDWVLSLGEADGGRLHAHEYADGTFKLHRDRIDPARGVLPATVHWTSEAPEGKLTAATLLGAFIVGVIFQKGRQS